MTELYPNFLNDPNGYAASRQFWETMCRDILGAMASEWETWFIKEGVEDGNPIFTLLSRRIKKAVRIIQVPSDGGWEPFSSWTDKMGDDLPGSIAVEEMVIHIVLTCETAQMARDTLEKWFLGAAVGS